MTFSAEIRCPVDQWVANHPARACTGAAKQALLAHLKMHLPRKTPQQLDWTLKNLLRNTRDVIRPDCTPNAYEQRALGAPTSLSKEVKDVRAAIHNPINNPINGPIRRAAMKRQCREEAIRLLEEKGFADHILPEEEVEELVDEILAEERPEFDDQSIIDLLDD
jgi:hypothetical protein